MKPWAKLALFGAALVATFGIAFGLGHVLVPENVVENWMHKSDTHEPSDAPEQRNEH